MSAVVLMRVKALQPIPWAAPPVLNLRGCASVEQGFNAKEG